MKRARESTVYPGWNEAPFSMRAIFMASGVRGKLKLKSVSGHVALRVLEGETNRCNEPDHALRVFTPESSENSRWLAKRARHRSNYVFISPPGDFKFCLISVYSRSARPSYEFDRNLNLWNFRARKQFVRLF